MIISDHAQEEMDHSNISEEEIRQCLECGELVIKQIVKGEKRYGKQIDFKDKTIMVIYTFEDNNSSNSNNEEKVITTYPIRRKKQWQN